MRDLLAAERATGHALTDRRHAVADHERVRRVLTEVLGERLRGDHLESLRDEVADGPGVLLQRTSREALLTTHNEQTHVRSGSG